MEKSALVLSNSNANLLTGRACCFDCVQLTVFPFASQLWIWGWGLAAGQQQVQISLRIFIYRSVGEGVGAGNGN